MVTSPAAALMIRDALAREAPMLTQVLGAPFAASALGQWLDPDPKTRRMSAAGHIGGLVAATITSGIAQVAEDDDGEIVGVALWAWYPRDGQSTSTGSAVSLLDPAILTIRRRQAALAHMTDSSGPPAVESYCLAYLGVRPDQQRQGIGSRLLVTHHALLHLRKMPAFLLADDRSRKLFERHRYTCIGLPQMLPGGPMVWAMRRPPVPADPL